MREVFIFFQKKNLMIHLFQVLLHFYQQICKNDISFKKFVDKIYEQKIITEKIKKELFTTMLNKKFSILNKKSRSVKKGDIIKWITKGELYKAKVLKVNDRSICIDSNKNGGILSFDRRMWI